jgi:hypothetical protein
MSSGVVLSWRRTKFTKQLKALRWRTPCVTLQAPCQTRAELFFEPPDHFTPGPYS